LFQISNDEQLTDGQKKAEKIKASFENPFQKVSYYHFIVFFMAFSTVSWLKQSRQN